MIQSFKDTATRDLFIKRRHRLWSNVQEVACRKLDQIHAAINLNDLKSPPGNQLEPLHGNRKGQHSIRVNGQCRICFVWKPDGAHDVEIVDYHDERKGRKRRGPQ